MKIVGIVGGVASGKSLVADMLARLGATTLDVDRIGHEILQEPAVIDAATQRWGAEVLQPDGRIDRQYVASRVFGDGNSAELAYWQGVTHPRITDRIRNRLSQLSAEPQPPSVVVLDAALLLEAGWDSLCHLLIFVDTPENIRKARARQRGWPSEQFSAREWAQLSIGQKRAKCDLVIDNSGTIEQTYKRVVEVWKRFSNVT